jgi:hypothetical protein
MLSLLSVFWMVCTPPSRAEEGAVERPISIWLDSGFGAPTGLMGGRLSYQLDPRWGVEAGGGLGFTGWQATAMGRFYHPFGQRGHGMLTAAAGPSLALNGRPVGYEPPHADEADVDASKIYTATWLNAEGAVEGNWAWFRLRFVLGVAVRVQENLSPLCEGVPTGRDQELNSCNPPHNPSAADIAAVPAFPYLGLDYGVAF